VSILLLLLLGAAVRFAVDHRTVGDRRLGSLAAPESAQRVLSAPVPEDQICANSGSSATHPWNAIFGGRPRVITLGCHDMGAVITAAMRDWLLYTVQDPATCEISVHVKRRRDPHDATDDEIRQDRQARLYLPARPLVLNDGTIVRLVSGDLEVSNRG
jgi:hypothetical protein